MMSKSIGKKGLELIKEFEGCKLTAYQDNGKYAIGYGHTAGVTVGMKITQKQADDFLKEDCQKFAAFVDNAEYVPFTEDLNANQRDALISFAYNCGQGSLKKLCGKRTIDQIPAGLVLYIKAGGKVLEGLKRRRNAEKELYLTPVKASTKPDKTSTETKKETIVKKVEKTIEEKQVIVPSVTIVDGKIQVSIGQVNESNTHDIKVTEPTPTRDVYRERANRSEVLWLQQILGSLGYYRGSINGIFNYDLLNAIKTFQAGHDLKVDGIVGPLTRKALESHTQK